MISMKSFLLGFLRDETGAEAIELAISGAVVAAGATAGYLLIKGEVKDQQVYLVRKLFNATPN